MWHTLTRNETFKRLKTDPESGLREKEILSRQAKYRQKSITRKK